MSDFLTRLAASTPALARKCWATSCLLHLDGDVDEGDLGVLHLLGHPVVDRLLVDDDPLDELRLVQALALLLDDLDVVDVGDDLAVPLLDDLQYRVDHDAGEVVPDA
jgi:hypothetical protein